MKERTKGLIAGALVSTTLFGIAGTALAANGAITLDVLPVNIKVNNEVFKPKDVNGKDVLVFTYNGTTYAPLRALAEAYGLEVGWDQASGTATVIDPEKVDETFSATSSVTTTTAELDRWVAGKVSVPQRVGINVIKIDDKYYEYFDRVERNNRDFMITYDNNIPLIFTDDINYSSWFLLDIMRQALMTDYTIEETENPFFDGKLTVQSPSLLDVVNIGSEPVQYLSATETHKPVWFEYHGAKVYNAVKNKGFYVCNNIRYYNGYVCANDVLAKLGIDKSFSITKYQDLLAIEWKK